MLLLEYARSIGIPMKGIHKGMHVGWTLDQDKARAAEAAGARIVPVYASIPALNGWEISFPIDEEKRE